MRLTIDRLGHRGDGVAEGPVYAALTLPGEVVEGEIAGGRIAAPKIITPSPDRVQPPCAHFKSCGGCALQHGSDGFVAVWKIGVVETALAAHGLTAPIRGIKTSPPGSRRRAALSGRRTKKSAKVGFHTRASGTIIDIPDCRILHPDILALIPACRALVQHGASRKAELTLLVTVSDAGADVCITGGKPLDGGLRQNLASIAAQASIARLSWDDELLAQHAPPVQKVQGIAVVPPPGAFLQATIPAQEALISAVTEAVGEAGPVIDLFAGCGTFSLPLARNTQVHAVEADGAMLAALDDAWRNADGLKMVSTETRDLFRRPVLVPELNLYKAVVLDPPRAGAAAQIAEIAASGVASVAYVSCNPLTFSKDARVLVDAGFGIDWIDVMDQFRWSCHVEIAARFSR